MELPLEVLFWPFVACLVITGIHTYLGLHVVSRGVIFVDLALAQIAAMGATIGAAGAALLAFLAITLLWQVVVFVTISAAGVFLAMALPRGRSGALNRDATCP